MTKFRIPLTLWGILMPLPLRILLGTIALSYDGEYIALIIGPLVVVCGLMLLISLSIAVLQVRPDGLVLYWVNRVRWEEISGAQLRGIMRLPHLVLPRRQGTQWWVPLYFHGPVDLRTFLREAAPEGSPIREALE